MTIGTIGSLGAGAVIPVSILVFTGIIDSFSSYDSSTCFINK